jgi:hypothetical protein
MNRMMKDEDKKEFAKMLREVADKLDEGVPVFDGSWAIRSETDEFAHKGRLHRYHTGVQSIDLSLHYQPHPNGEYEAMKKAGVMDGGF